jgi:hypothetical protein
MFMANSIKTECLCEHVYTGLWKHVLCMHT